MASVWVIEAGEYSSYRVIGVFSTKGNAERVLAAYKGDIWEPKISEWPLDPWIDALNHGHRLWQVLMKRNGDTESVVDHGRDISLDYEGQLMSENHKVWRRTNDPHFKSAGIETCDVLSAWVYARDEKHAVKIVNEIRTTMIANNEWE